MRSVIKWKAEDGPLPGCSSPEHRFVAHATNLDRLADTCSDVAGCGRECADAKCSGRPAGRSNIWPFAVLARPAGSEPTTYLSVGAIVPFKPCPVPRSGQLRAQSGKRLVPGELPPDVLVAKYRRDKEARPEVRK